MGYFAKVNENNIVTEVIRAEPDVIAAGVAGDPDQWIQTSFNTHGGKHCYPGTWDPDGYEGLRKNFAQPGYTYDPDLDAFIPPKPFPSWTLNTDTCLWEPPVPFPADWARYDWDEENQQWIDPTIEE